MSKPQQTRDEKARQCSAAWLSALQSATAILSQGARRNTKMEEFDQVITYMEVMEQHLKKLETYWDQPPLKMPPAFHGSFAKNNNNLKNHHSQEPPMAMRRILIRVVTAHSEILAFKGSQYRFTKPVPEWKVGADMYGESLSKIHEALNLADSECARLLDRMEEETAVDDAALVEDAQIVQVSIQFLTEERDKYRESAVKEANRLRRKLEPQWTSRDGARERIGQDKWKNNPAPKNDFRNIRQEDEQQLREIDAAIQQLDAMDMPQGTVHERLDTTQQPRQRYNGVRPWDLSRRLPFDLYPDPTHFGWTFTGSWNNQVEFFERRMDDESLCKLDWYFTTGTVKTSMDHPLQGKTQMFGDQVDPVVYREILENPRVHTNIRYQTRDKKPFQ